MPAARRRVGRLRPANGRPRVALLDREAARRRAVELERDKYSGQLDMLRQILLEDRAARLDDATINKLKNMTSIYSSHRLDGEEADYEGYGNAAGGGKYTSTSPAAAEASSVHDVEDFSFFDNTQELCRDSPVAAATTTPGGGRTSRRRRLSDKKVACGGHAGDAAQPSPPPAAAGLETNPRSAGGGGNRSRKKKRSRSVAFQLDQIEEQGGEESPRHRRRSPSSSSSKSPVKHSPRSSSSQPPGSGGRISSGGSGRIAVASASTSSAHVFSHKPVLRMEKCAVCHSRIAFGKVAAKCCLCRVAFHQALYWLTKYPTHLVCVCVCALRRAQKANIGQVEAEL